MSQFAAEGESSFAFGGILFALEQAAARENARNKNDGGCVATSSSDAAAVPSSQLKPQHSWKRVEEKEMENGTSRLSVAAKEFVPASALVEHENRTPLKEILVLDGGDKKSKTSCNGKTTPSESDKVSSQLLHATTTMSVDDNEIHEEEEEQEYYYSPLWWHSFIPEGTVDPISLELLVENAYPPFPLVVDEPYTPIYPGMWPPLPTVNRKEDRELTILKQQWGDGVFALKSEEKDNNSDASLLLGRKFNLFDGHILANYLVSTQQFIDPYNRRDLTRGELEALDEYLAHNNLPYTGVCLAYDNRKVTINTAGIMAQSEEGRAAARAETLRRNADSILNQMFTIRKTQVGRSTKKKKGKSRDLTFGAEKIKLMGQDEMTSLRPTQQGHSERGNAGVEFYERQALEASLRPLLEPPDEAGVYESEGGGFVLIDDDINPGLRGRLQVDDNEAVQQFPSLTTNNGRDHFDACLAPKWAVKKVNLKAVEHQPKAKEAEMRHQKEEEVQQPNNAIQPASIEIIRNNKKKKILLSTQGRGTDEAKSREEMKKNVPPPDYSKLKVLRPSPVATESANIDQSDASIANTGWSRPVSNTAKANPAKYAASLIAGATCHMAELAKLEKKLIRFLADDGKPSLSLKPMASESLRKLVHDYCRYWNLCTEGLDPAPKNRASVEVVMIKCKKMDDTCAPCPLLSDAARHPVLGVTFKKKKRGKMKPFEAAFAT